MTVFSGCSDGTRNLLDIIREKGYGIRADCGGHGTCGKCRVRFVSDAPKPHKIETEKLPAEALEEGFRLACLTKIAGSFVVEIEDGGEESETLTKASSPVDTGLSLAVAVDIGTTTIAAALVDRQTKKMLSVETSINHQNGYGADVIARIQAANEGKGGELKRLIRKDVSDLLSALGVGKNVPVIISANTTMQHLWQGLSCATLGVAPYTPVDISCRTVDGCTLLPGISTFVGADIVSGIVAMGMDRAKKPCILIDLGTNGEMAIGCREGILVASAAAGPAFEGGNISCGVAGITGAISSVTITQGAVQYETIRGGAPIGLCGSGVIEVVYELLKDGIIDETGLMSEPYFESGFTLAPNVVFTQEDVREVQLAKSAIRAGVETLLVEYGIGYDEVDALYLAGGFGTKIDIKKACGIGLLPGELLDRTKAVGNTSLKGAVSFLFEEKIKERFLSVCSCAKEVNLAASTFFGEEYVERMSF